jgi:hypothetical protein
MQDLTPAADDQVILAWLQAEIESDRFQKNIVGNPPNLPFLALVRQHAHQPDLADPQQNTFRRDIIGQIRGFGRGIYIFTGLANDIEWRRAHVSIAEVGAMLYANNVATWTTLAPNTLRVSEGAENVGHIPTNENANMHILSLARTICHTDPVPHYPEIICLKRPDGRISVMEGHTRATAYVLEEHRLPDGVDIYLGDSASTANWAYL